ncbi:hypothetical protein [Amphibiibacter pelophylacis]|uniref:hypothetical protein n=1 Tax=Amphibiibacter pelophylacis TaxID=1799477 RepID=UPI003BFA701C
MDAAIARLDRLLLAEENFGAALRKSAIARRLSAARTDIQSHLHNVSRHNDLLLMVAVERSIVEGDLTRYANSRSMISSLKAALGEISALERHMRLVDDASAYEAVDQAHRLPGNRRNGLPLDEARQALASHCARLANMDKSRLDDNEKKVLDARRAAVSRAEKLYIARQSKALSGLTPAPPPPASAASPAPAPLRGR